MYSRWLPLSPRHQKSWRIESFCTHFTWPSAQRGGPFCFIVVSRCPGFGIRHPGPVSGKAEARSPKPEQLTTLLHEGSSSPPTHWHRSRLRGAGRDSRVPLHLWLAMAGCFLHGGDNLDHHRISGDPPAIERRARVQPGAHFFWGGAGLPLDRGTHAGFASILTSER